MSLSISPFSGLTTSFLALGFHGQYKLLAGPPGSWAFRWGGFDVSSGFDYSKVDVGFKLRIDKAQQQSTVATETLTMSWEGDGRRSAACRASLGSKRRWRARRASG